MGFQCLHKPTQMALRETPEKLHVSTPKMSCAQFSDFGLHRDPWDRKGRDASFSLTVEVFLLTVVIFGSGVGFFTPHGAEPVSRFSKCSGSFPKK